MTVDHDRQPMPGPPPVNAADRAYAAWEARTETDYFFSYWTALGWTVLSLGLYSFYVFYQLVRRMRDHNLRRLEFLDASLTFAWEEAGRRGLQDDLTPSFQQASAQIAVLRRLAAEFRDPAIWLLLSIFFRGVVELIAFVLLDQDFVKHDQAEVALENELSLIFDRLGQVVTPPVSTRVKRTDKYVGRIVATIFSLGIYLFWWFYNQMQEPNLHFQANWLGEDAVIAAIGALRGPRHP